MPELPEVETVARLLRPPLVGRTITGVRVGWPRSVGETPVRRYGAALRGARVEDIRRRGKYLIFDLMRDGAPRHLVGHLRMSGRMFVDPSDVVQRRADIDRRIRRGGQAVINAFFPR